MPQNVALQKVRVILLTFWLSCSSLDLMLSFQPLALRHAAYRSVTSIVRMKDPMAKALVFEFGREAQDICSRVWYSRLRKYECTVQGYCL